MISFIIPIRGRADQVSGCIHTIRKYHPGSEILLMEQKNQEPFMRGQLCNLGFKKSKGEIVVFQDVDIRFLRDPEIESYVRKLQGPFLPFDRITHLEEVKLGVYKELETVGMMQGFGACSILTRDQFIESNGFSNLLRGWGVEDNILDRRVGRFLRLRERTLGHIKHPASDASLVMKNAAIFHSRPPIDPNKDSFRETLAHFGKESQIELGIRKLEVLEIMVPETFEYLNKLENP